MGGVAIVVFSDLVDSTELLARLGDDRMERLRRDHVADTSTAVLSNGGRVVKTLGDGMMATFGSALSALRAAAAIQAAVGRQNSAYGGVGLAARVGIAAGEPIADGDDLHGMPVVIASRLSEAASSGEVLVQDLVRALIASRDMGALGELREYELKGVPEPVRASLLSWRELEHDRGDATVEASGGDMAQVNPRAGVAALGDTAASSDRAPPANGIRLPPMLAAYAGEPLIGRDREIRELCEATKPRPGRRAVLVLGEPGIGKTRHAAAAASDAHAAGALVVLARCPPEATIAFEPWVRALGELALAGDDDWRASLAEAAGADLATLVPELRPHAEVAERAVAEEVVAAEGARYRVLRGIVAALDCAAGQAPLHVVLDDAHWCDPASAQALAHLLDSAPDRLVLVATARDQEMGRRHQVSRVLTDLRRTGDLVELRLEGLDADGLASLVNARVGRAIAPRLAERLRARTAGNPFFAGELAQDLEERGGLRDGEALETAPVPEAVAGVVEGRLARIGTDAEALLGAAAAIGPTSPVAVAARAAGLDGERVDHAIREALDERLAIEVAAAKPTIAFPHALVREALIAGTASAERARLHLAIATALEDEPDAEPAELARHRGLAVELTGPEPAIAAYRTAAAAAAEGHDHERAASHLRSLLALLPQGDNAAWAPVLLELGEQELLAADLVRGRDSFRAACDAARATGDAATFGRAALGFAGGDIGFGFEIGTDDPSSVALLREGLEMLGEEEPRLSLRMGFRLTYLLIYTDEHAAIAELASRAGELERRLGDTEAHVLARFTALVAQIARSADPLHVLDMVDERLEIANLADQCDREDLIFRVVQATAWIHYVAGDIPQCERATERLAEIAEHLGSPRFSWEVDMNRGLRLLDRGNLADGEALIQRAGAVMRRLRPDLHIGLMLTWLLAARCIYGAEVAAVRAAVETMESVSPRGIFTAIRAFYTALDGDFAQAQRLTRGSLTDDLEPLRRPDGHLPAALCFLAYATTLVGDRESAERLRPLFEPLRSRLVALPPAPCFGILPEMLIGRLELLLGHPDAAAVELRMATAKADALECVWLGAATRVDLARALHRCGKPTEARTALTEAESIARRYGIGLAAKEAAQARAEIEGRESAAPEPTAERTRPVRALASRSGRRALATMVRGLDDVALERRFAEPRRQRALVRATARGFQPAEADGFNGIVAYELEPFAIEPPPTAPWRWAIEVDTRAGRARLREPAPLDAAVTIHFGLADWVRIVAGLQEPLAAMVAGRCSVEGDVLVAARLQAMFGAN